MQIPAPLAHAAESPPLRQMAPLGKRGKPWEANAVSNEQSERALGKQRTAAGCAGGSSGDIAEAARSMRCQSRGRHRTTQLPRQSATEWQKASNKVKQKENKMNSWTL